MYLTITDLSAAVYMSQQFWFISGWMMIQMWSVEVPV
jgi:hypothetical protein